MPLKTIKDGTVSDAYVALLADRGVDYLFGNAGTDFAPLIEAFAKAKSLGTPMPVPVTCPHENTAMHMAIGYYLITGRPQAVMVHVNVGTANGINGLLNAARGNVPVLFTAGRSPTNEDQVFGHRSLDIHWTQEMFDQAGMVREAVKWDYELRNVNHLKAVVDRALNIAMSDPRGPVYLALPREVMAAPADEFSYSGPSRHQPSTPSAPDPDAADQVAALFAKAKNPLIITSWAGRHGETWQALSDFAERFAVPVVQYRSRYMSIPTDHSMHLGYEPGELMEIADLVLALDIAVPWLPAVHRLPEETKVVHMAPDPLHSYVPLRGHPCDIALACATHLGLRALTEAMEVHESEAKDRIEGRRGRVADRRRAMQEAWQQTLERARIETPINPVWISHCISRIKGEDSIVMREAALSLPHIEITRPGELINAGAGSGLGWGLGAALGAKLAARDRLVIAAEGDGSYLFGNPLSAHYVAAEQDLPFLTVIFNNGRWNAVERSTLGLNPDGFAAKSKRPPLTFLDAMTNYEKVAEIADGYGEKVTDPAEMMPALERALKAVTIEKRQAILNVVSSSIPR